MKQTIVKSFIACFAACLLMAGCGNSTGGAQAAAADKESVAESAESVEDSAAALAESDTASENENKAAFPLEDGVYSVKFDTDSTMFRVNEACEGRGILTVEDGGAVLHIVLPSKNILNLYPGLAEDAQAEGAELLSPTLETVTYSDGYEEEVNAFDVPVTVLDEEFDLALIGKKGKWYDHKVSISDPQLIEDGEDAMVPVTLEGGSGRASIGSPAKVTASGDGYVVTICWSSPYYDYMIVDGVRYEPVNTEGNSVFEIPVADLSGPLTVIADTVAMSEPHEIEYTITFDTSAM